MTLSLVLISDASFNVPPCASNAGGGQHDPDDTSKTHVTSIGRNATLVKDRIVSALRTREKEICAKNLREETEYGHLPPSRVNDCFHPTRER